MARSTKKKTEAVKVNNIDEVNVNSIENNAITETSNKKVKDYTLPYAPAPWCWDRDNESEFLMDRDNNIVEFNNLNKKLMELAPEMYELLERIHSNKNITNDKEMLNEIEKMVNKIKYYHPYSYSFTHKSGINLIELLNEFEDMMGAFLDYIEVSTFNSSSHIFKDEFYKFVEAYGYTSIVRGEWEIELNSIDSTHFSFTIRVCDYVDKIVNAEGSYTVVITEI